MNLFKTLSMAALVAASTLTASAWEFTLEVPNAAGVSAQFLYSPLELHDGTNVIEVADGNQGYLQITGVSPYTLTSVTDQNGNPMYMNGTTFYQWFSESSNGGKVYTLGLKNLDESRTSSFTINIDDTSAAIARFKNSSSSLTLINGENIIKFDPEVDSPLSISNVYGRSIYQVTLDGAKVSPQYGSNWSVPLTDGCEVGIQVAFPDIDAKLSFSYSEKGEGVVSSITSNGTPVSDFNGTEAYVKVGNNVVINFSSDYQINQLKVNNNNVYIGSSYSYTLGTVTDDTNIYIDATPYETYPITVNVNKPELLNFYKGQYSYYGTPITLTGTTTVVNMKETEQYVCWKLNGGSDIYIKSVTIDGNSVSATTTNAEVKENSVIDIEIATVELNENVVFWFDKTEITPYFSLQTSDHTNINVAPGYTVMPFYSGYNPIALNWYSYTTVVGEVYLNDAIINPNGDTNCNMNLSNLDVVKVFYESEPVVCEVSFDVTGVSGIEVIRDIIVPVTDLENAFTAFKGTQIDIAPATDSQKLKVSVNGEDLSADEAGAYQFIVDNEKTAVVITDGEQSSVATINAINVAEGVYNLHGQKLNGNLNELPAGIYIVNGKKIVK